MILHVPHIPTLSTVGNADDTIALLNTEGARITIDSLNWADQFPYSPLTTVAVAHNGEHLLIDFFVRCNYLRAENYVNNSPVAEDSCVEFFVSPHPGSEEYWNFEFNCIGTVNASHRTERHNPTRLTDAEVDTVIRVASCGTRPFCELEGLFSWNLMVAIPLSLIGLTYEGKPLAMRGNFNKCASRTSSPHYLSWAPIHTPRPDFHQPASFGEIVLL